MKNFLSLPPVFQRTIIAFLSVIFVLSVGLSFFPLRVAAASSASSRFSQLSNPRLANYYVNWDLKAEDLSALSQWNLVILDMEHQVKHPEFIKKLRELNPSIIILAYITSQEVTDGTIIDFERTTPLRYELFKGIHPEWYLTSVADSKFSFWPNTYVLNVTANCPVIQGQTWNNYLATFVANRLASSGLWDGVLYDNVWQNIDWFTKSRGGLDFDNDGKADSANRVDTAWRKGYELLLAQTKHLVPSDFLVLANVGPGHSVYASSLDGSLFESFPGFGWTYAMREASQQIAKGRMPFLILNSTSGKMGSSEDWRSMRFGLTSALLIDAYFSFDHGDQHAQLWWYDEYAVDLGAPVGKAYSVTHSKNFVDDSVWRRDFTRGIVVTNPSAVKRTVKLGGTYQKIKGTQDSITNNGQNVTEVTLGAHDGIVLLKAETILKNTVFINGARVKTVSLSGSMSAVTTVFSAAAPSGVPAFIGSIFGETTEEGVKINGPKFEIWNKGTLVFSDYPFNLDYAGDMALAISKPVSGRPTVFAVAQKKGGQVIVYNTTGKKIATIYPLGVSYQGGFSLAFADVVGGDEEELIIGTGKGVPSQIMVCDQTYLNVVARFNPYDKTELSGIAIAAFKPVKKGAAAFTTLSQGTKPLLRFFTVDGKKLQDIPIARSLPAKKLDLRAVPGKNPDVRIEEY